MESSLLKIMQNKINRQNQIKKQNEINRQNQIKKQNEINRQNQIKKQNEKNKEWYNWASDDEVRQLKLKYFSEDAFVICISGQIAINNYPKSLLESIKRLRDQEHNIHLLVLAELEVIPSGLTKELYNEITSYDWVKSFTVDKKEILNYYRFCDVLASTYRDYSNHVIESNKIKEYLLCDKPILCSRGKQREIELGKDYFGLYNCKTCDTVLPLFYTEEYLKNPDCYLDLYEKYFREYDNNNLSSSLYIYLHTEIKNIKKILLRILNSKISEFTNPQKNITLRKKMYIIQNNVSNINTINDYNSSFSKYSSKYEIININYDNLIYNIKNNSLKSYEFIKNNKSILVLCYDIVHVKMMNPLIQSFLSNLTNKKFIFIQDEYYDINNIVNFLNIIKITAIFTVLTNNNDIKLIYKNINNKNVKFIKCLTGYCDTNDNNMLQLFKCINEKTNDIIYRGRKLHPRYGLLGKYKFEIGYNIKNYIIKNNINLKHNISSSNNDRIYKLWKETISDSKLTLATPSGSNTLNYDTKLLEEINSHFKIPLRVLSFEIKNDNQYIDAINFINTKIKINEELNVNALSPKMFEAILSGTVLVMLRGDDSYYSGVLKADKHYIPLNMDYSNIDEVINKCQDNVYLQTIANQAFEDIILSEKYTYKIFIESVENIINDYDEKINNSTNHIFNLNDF